MNIFLIKRKKYSVIKLKELYEEEYITKDNLNQLHTVEIDKKQFRVIVKNITNEDYLIITNEEKEFYTRVKNQVQYMKSKFIFYDGIQFDVSVNEKNNSIILMKSGIFWKEVYEEYKSKYVKDVSIY
ncbi:hypothetical protein Ccar_08860 [Clostridium carboxidivorans P7]|uniref:Uncharacterized protein n=1 Tax=Clostridium carboxidivorans P7 TaxID=536227 RepID=C6PXM9_9CLOT|nr:hypothetical protein [Clostridium carboxidivorans]AKN30947.1 hypothetical protein Ccar_08860 [Clostridium carboxidivorans P7]EET86007.1 hypothetical protein CcarbDRAFT_3546 [Clostridium carboxidivorans P7]EFG88796.1 hypothetical protein CLCAR_1541 [Clostridium carboxidivorans P7]